MVRDLLTVALVIAAFMGAAALLAPRGRRSGATNRRTSHEDCAVSECAADGVPLTAYAG